MNTVRPSAIQLVPCSLWGKRDAFQSHSLLFVVLFCLVLPGFKSGLEFSGHPFQNLLWHTPAEIHCTGIANGSEFPFRFATSESQAACIAPAASLISFQSIPFTPRSARAGNQSIARAACDLAFGPHSLPVSGSPSLLMLGILFRP